jgi:radical SAM superfamily enzyme YgiQ (UPF0313 family)
MSKANYYYGNKVLLNCLPPAHTLMPSAALNILKGVLKKNGFNAEVVYWNVKFENTLAVWARLFGEDNYDFSRLLPFVNYLAHDCNDAASVNNISKLIENTLINSSIRKSAQVKSLYAHLPETTFNNINSIINTELSNTFLDDVFLYGFSAKFYQWIPAMIIAEKVKAIKPQIKTIIGGFDSKTAAVEIMRNFSCFDFAVWGEGEYPLLELCKTLKENPGERIDIAGLVSRENGKLSLPHNAVRKYFDLDNYPEPDYDDFFSKVKEEKEKGIFLYYPVETIRGCHWNKCKFCVLANGYKYRERNVDSVINEIKSAISKYDIGYFQLLDNNVVGCNRQRFDELLEKLKALYIQSSNDFTVFTEIIPYGLNATDYRKMAIAGIRMVQIGGESLADSLIRKMNKMNSFSDNLLAYKYCLKYGIKPDGANIITGIPGEKDKDVRQCYSNLHYLRFFIGGQLMMFTESPFALERLSKFYKEMGEKEKESYDAHFIYNLLPQVITANMNRFELFFFRKSKPPNKKLWDKFFKLLESYGKANYSYKIFRIDDQLIYEEFSNRVKTASLIFDEPMQWDMLVFANERLRMFEEMLLMLRKKYKNLTKARLRIMLNELKSHNLIYFDEKYDRIVSVIDTDNVF